MSWSDGIRLIAGACVVMATLTMRDATAGMRAASACPARADAVVTRIDIFDGDPADQASLAPDDGGKGRNTYTVGNIYAHGGFVTVRCHRGATFEDVKLQEPVSTCRFSGGDSHPALHCIPSQPASSRQPKP